MFNPLKLDANQYYFLNDLGKVKYDCYVKRQAEMALLEGTGVIQCLKLSDKLVRMNYCGIF